MTTDSQDPRGPKPPPEPCSEPGCRVPRQFVTFKGPDGRPWCISHSPNKTAKLLAIAKGGDAQRQKAAGVLPPGAPDPSWRNREEILTWCEVAAGKVLRAELDRSLVAEARMLAGVALVAHDLAARELLEKLTKMVPIKGRRA
jgi:hypothetical protein